MMLARIVFTAVVCLAACTVGRADDPVPGVPVVLGDSGVGPEAAVAPAQPARESVLVEEPRPVSDLPEFAVPDSVLPCDAGPQWHTAYTVVDALFMQRASPSFGVLAVTSQASVDPGEPVITTADLQYPTFSGMRLFQGWRDSNGAGFEMGYLGIWGMFADALAVSPSSDLAVPGGLGLVAGSGFDAASAIRPVLNGSVNGCELNVFSTRVHDCRRHDPLPWRRALSAFEGSTLTADWLLGIRWAGITETASLNVTAGLLEPSTTAYRVFTSSHLVGPQIGHRRRLDWANWSLEGWAKVGLMGGFQSQSQGSVIGPADLVEIREPRSSTRAGVGMIGDLSATAVRRLGDHWGIRAGYTLLWFSDTAPAAEQWDFTNTPTSDLGVNISTLFLHGATLGLEAAW